MGKIPAQLTENGRKWKGKSATSRTIEDSD